jgi:cell division ATPase FtsA
LQQCDLCGRVHRHRGDHVTNDIALAFNIPLNRAKN